MIRKSINLRVGLRGIGLTARSRSLLPLPRVQRPFTTSLSQSESTGQSQANQIERIPDTTQPNTTVISSGLKKGKGAFYSLYSPATVSHGPSIKVHFVDSKKNPIKTIETHEGDDLLHLAHEWDVDLEGACEASCACSTCHVILQPQVFDQLEEPSDDENDMLDLAFGLTDTSRLGCQVHVAKSMDGMVVQLPSATRNMFVDGAKPAKH
ncbi:hypothetical protein E3P80_02565 [Wallemia ichthyophaga]|nr:hypothetical protein E3P97_02635 [Wallemia ichthyophaga]TIB31426.1 hypothetical protein E3P85_02288 [Wallemia ichthyophaga]TIB41105.1 hypothetical protein E3P83_02294 [Wallemia ichthyophaga]TIB52530.1 hypothetical protein E3P80_02565 [Wallemia ichthyophaga]